MSCAVGRTWPSGGRRSTHSRPPPRDEIGEVRTPAADQREVERDVAAGNVRAKNRATYGGVDAGNIGHATAASTSGAADHLRRYTDVCRFALQSPPEAPTDAPAVLVRRSSRSVDVARRSVAGAFPRRAARARPARGDAGRAQMVDVRRHHAGPERPDDARRLQRDDARRYRRRRLSRQHPGAAPAGHGSRRHRRLGDLRPVTVRPADRGSRS